MSNQQEIETPPVAIVSVHGVGDPKPGEFAARIATMLLGDCDHRSEARIAESFETTPIRISDQSNWGLTKPAEPGPNPGVAQSCEALANIAKHREDGIYETLRLEQRSPNKAEGSPPIHLYELHWGDLSRAPGWFTTLVITLYRLVFHLVVLGKRAVGLAADAEPDRPLLRSAQRLQQLAIGLLPTAIPILNLYLLAAALLLAAKLLSGATDGGNGTTLATLWMPVLLAILVALPALALLIMLGVRSGRFGPFIALLVATGLGAGTLLLETPTRFALVGWIISIAAILAALLVSRKIVNSQEHPLAEKQPFFMRLQRFWRTAPWLGLIAVLMFGGHGLWVAHAAAPDETLVLVGVHTLHGLFLLLQVCWLLLFVTLAVSLIQWLVAWRQHGRYAASVRALFTGTLGLFLSSALFYLLTVVLWGAVLQQLQDQLDRLTVEFSVPFELFYWHLVELPQSTPVSAYIDGLFKLTTGNGMDGFLVLVLIAVLIALPGILPSAWSERRPCSEALRHDQDAARRLGRWLDRSLLSLLIAGGFLLLAFVWLILGYTPMFGQLAASDLLPSVVFGNKLTTAVGGSLAAAVPLLLIFRKQLPDALHNLLDIVLDVDNWLQRPPRKASPRGLILARALALLHWMSHNGNYRRIVFVAHSQGTVISADLLRLLQAEPKLAERVFGTHPPDEIRLITAGSPLRQLYAWRFPHEYGWVEQASVGPKSEPDPDPDPDLDTGPNPAELYHVSRWINLFCSGDYVGRALWSHWTQVPLWAPPKAELAAAVPTKPCADLLLGAGAHTRYFDGSDPRVCAIIRAQTT
ncbi:MAG TPA: hypothetical protein DDY14_09665 [Chromatiaceae bacterium]|jgi:hypothetical protein|nr:MAG: hypothetical protein N838_02125 [Thiohalocapsa sp. PB-PSB1]QQO54393.1 MAG: hypothetical protein N838_14620 [Thiohalocapsa sp. PB-PSB1]HBG95568.1 hypothetical protein [Chromatiaceae bacterium]HCS89739.1 hypothetical protein [Chromatiaceae bacterium]